MLTITFRLTDASSLVRSDHYTANDNDDDEEDQDTIGGTNNGHDNEI